MAAADQQAFFLTPPPPPRHLAELRIDTAPSAVAFSAPCGAAKGAGRKRRCLVPASSVRKRMLLELAPFDAAPSSTPPPSPAGEFSFGTALRVMVAPASPGNIFAFGGNAAGSEARSHLSFLERPKTPTATTGPTANGGFVFAAPPEGPLTPTSTNTSGGGLSFLAASPNKQPLTPMGSTATGGFAASSVPSLIPLKPARNDTGGFAFPSPGRIGSPASAATKESMPLAGLATQPFVSTASRSPPPLRNSGDGRPSLFLRRAATRARLQQLQEQQQQFTPPPQKIAKTNTGEASRSSVMSGSSATPCSTFFTSPSKDAAKQEAEKAFSEASRSPVRPATPEKENKQEREVEVSSSHSERSPNSPRERASTSPTVVCSGAEVVVRVTCKCGVHKEFCFYHRL